MNKIVSSLFLGILFFGLLFVCFNYFSSNNLASISGFTSQKPAESSNIIQPITDKEVKIEPAVQEIHQTVQQPTPVISTPAPTPQKEDPQITIEKCKTQYNIHKSSQSVDLEKQLTSFKAVMDDIALKSYQECVSNGAQQAPVGIGPSAYSSYITTIKSFCQNSFNENTQKEEGIISNNKNEQYNKLEQQLQAEYFECINQ